MLKKLGLIILWGVALGGCSLVPQKSGLEIVSYPSAKVFLDGKEAGFTPYNNKSLLPGEVSIKLVSSLGEWSKKLELKNNINTVVDWEFGKDEQQSSGYVLSMEKTGDNQKSGLMVSTNPDKVAVAVDNEIKDLAPTRIDDIMEGDRQVTLSYPNYKTINVFVRAVNGYKLTIEANLAKEEGVNNNVGVGDTTVVITSQKTEVVILSTETGWLRVRDSASNSGAEVAKVYPGEKYDFIEETSDWMKIGLKGGKTGWVSAKYAAKQQVQN